MQSIVEIFADHAATLPDRLFVADDKGRSFTYGQAWNIIKAGAGKMAKTYELSKGGIVACECTQDSFFLMVKLACELAGAVFVPIENGASMERKRLVASETECSLWIGNTEVSDGCRSVSLEQLFEEPDETTDLTTQFPSGDEVAEILYTTGTTGTSKGIVMTHSANVALAENIMYGVEMKEDNVELIPVPISHSHGLRCCYANIMNGSSVIIVDGLLNIKKVFGLIEDYHVTALDISPSAASMFIKLSKGSFWERAKKLDYIQLGTASLPGELKRELTEHLQGVRLYNFYGSTESGRSCILEFSAFKDKDNCIGKPTHNARISFANDQREFINATKENPGLLASAGGMNMLGYYKNSDLTDEVVRDGYVFTSDLGYIDEEGFVYVLGRKGDVITYNGIKIVPEEVEEAALRCGFVKDACCVARQIKGGNQVPFLFVSIKEGYSFDKGQLVSELEKSVDANKMPKGIELIDNIPRTANGKLQRNVLRDM